MDFEWTRIITVTLALIAIIQLIIFYRRTHEYGVIAPITWLTDIILYSIFKFIVDGDPKFYTLSVVWNNFILIHGIAMLIIGGFLFKDIKSWIYRK